MQIKLNNISFSYDKDIVLDDISLEYNKNNILALIGPNGGGKSTLLKIILGLIKANSGNVQVNATTGYVPQFSPLNASFLPTLKEVVLMGRLSKNLFYNKLDKQIADECIKSVNLENFKNCKINELSGGQKQRAFIARALACKAEILLLDEPTASLDPKSSAQIYELLLNLHKQGLGIIIASHDTTMVKFFANQIAFVNKKIYMHENTPQQVNFNQLLAQNHFCEIELASLACTCK